MTLENKIKEYLDHWDTVVTFKDFTSDYLARGISDIVEKAYGRKNISSEELNKEVKKWLNSFTNDEWEKQIGHENVLFLENKIKSLEQCIKDMVEHTNDLEVENGELKSVIVRLEKLLTATIGLYWTPEKVKAFNEWNGKVNE